MKQLINFYKKYSYFIWSIFAWIMIFHNLWEKNPDNKNIISIVFWSTVLIMEKLKHNGKNNMHS